MLQHITIITLKTHEQEVTDIARWLPSSTVCYSIYKWLFDYMACKRTLIEHLRGRLSSLELNNNNNSSYYILSIIYELLSVFIVLLNNFSIFLPPHNKKNKRVEWHYIQEHYFHGYQVHIKLIIPLELYD